MRILFCILFYFTINNSLIAQNKDNSAYFDFPVRCIGKELDGTLTLESNGKGRNRQDAYEQAMKNAVYAVIFKGIKDGNGECNRDPILLSPMAFNNNEDFFSSFFIDKGGYTDFVSLKDERISNKINRNAKKTKEFQQRMVVVIVNQRELKKMLEKNNIKN